MLIIQCTKQDGVGMAINEDTLPLYSKVNTIEHVIVRT